MIAFFIRKSSNMTFSIRKTLLKKFYWQKKGMTFNVINTAHFYTNRLISIAIPIFSRNILQHAINLFLSLFLSSLRYTLILCCYLNKQTTKVNLASTLINHPYNRVVLLVAVVALWYCFLAECLRYCDDGSFVVAVAPCAN